MKFELNWLSGWTDSGCPCLRSPTATIYTALCSSDSFTILGLWVLGLAVSNINESQLQTYES